jgi:hypothetical protein
MSVATEFASIVVRPERAGRCRAGQLASVTMLYPPSEHTITEPLRLTRRGVLVVGVAVAVLATVLVGTAWLSAPGAATSTAPASTTVTVESGDSLWSIATRMAPGRDPRAEVADLQRLNRLDGAYLAPGQVIRTH